MIAIIFSKRWWQFGAIESIFLVALIGLSIDNVGLLAYNYSCSYEPKRNEKIEQSYR
jgi:hypothetical protein